MQYVLYNIVTTSHCARRAAGEISFWHEADDGERPPARCCRTSRRATPRGPCTLPPTTPRTTARTSSSTPSRPARSRSACGAASARRWQQMSSPTPASMCAQDTNHQRVCPTVAVLQQTIAAAQLCLSHPWARLRRCLLPVAVGAAGYRALSHGSEGRI